MLFRKALILSANNWKVMVKALVCQVLILALLMAFCFLIFGDLVEDVFNMFTAGEWEVFLGDTVQSIGDGTFDGDAFADGLKDCLRKTKQAIEAFPNIWNRMEMSYIMLIVIVVVYRMLIAFSDVAAGFQLNEFMTSNGTRPFTWYLVKKFGESCKFIFWQMLITLPIDVILLSGCVIVSLILMLALGWWVIFPVLVFVLAMYAIRQSYFAFWLPAIATDELSVGAGLKKGLSVIPYRFGRVFVKTFLVVFVMTVITLTSFIYIHNNMIKFIACTVPNLLLFFFLKCVNFVEYFEATHRPYFHKQIDVEGTERYNRKHTRKHKVQ